MATKSKQTKSDEFIKPIITVNGEKHVLQKKFLEDSAPELTSVGYINLGEGRSHNWVSYVSKLRVRRSYL